MKLFQSHLFFLGQVRRKIYEDDFNEQTLVSHLIGYNTEMRLQNPIQQLRNSFGGK